MASCTLSGPFRNLSYLINHLHPPASRHEGDCHHWELPAQRTTDPLHQHHAAGIPHPHQVNEEKRWLIILHLHLPCTASNLSGCRYLQEYTALGTGGGMYHFRDQINSGNPDLFFVLNADVCCDFPLQEMMDFQQETQAEFVILGTEVVRFSFSRCLSCICALYGAWWVVPCIASCSYSLGSHKTCIEFLASIQFFPLVLRMLMLIHTPCWEVLLFILILMQSLLRSVSDIYLLICSM